MVRIVIFSILYIVPGIIVILCNIYEYQHRQNWALNHNCQCKSKSPFHGLITEDNSGVKLYIVFLLKYIMYLIVGITSGFWIWSSKTIDSLNRFYGRLCCFYCCGACKTKGKKAAAVIASNNTNKNEIIRQQSTNNSMSAHLMSNISYNNNQQQFVSSNSSRAYKQLLNQQPI